VRCNLGLVDQPVQIGSRAIGCVAREPFRLDGEALLGVMVLTAPTSAWRMARDASTSMMMPFFTSMR
jgi:hypothetical protein